MRLQTRPAALLFAVLAGLIVLAGFAYGAPPPKHGGITFISGPLAVELVLLKPSGGYQVYFMDSTGEEVPASTGNAVTLAINRPAVPVEKITLHIDDSGESWIGTGRNPGALMKPGAPIATARLSWSYHGVPEETDVPFGTVFQSEFKTAPGIAKAGEPVQLGFVIRDFFGRSMRTLEIVHEKPMHLLVVSRDLSEFWHIHPVLAADNVFRVSHVFPNGGDYRLYLDYTPSGAPNRIQPFDLKVEGKPRPAVPLTVTKDEAIGGGMKMVMTMDKPLRAGEDIGFSMSVTNAASGAPIHDLQPYLGAWAHIAIVSEDGQDFLHVHPIEDPGQLAAANARPGLETPSVIRTKTGFRHPGLYKIWVQIQRNNHVTDMAFVVRVAAGGTSLTQTPHAPPGSILIDVSSSGFEPASITARAGQPLKLAFFRIDAANCAREVVFPAFGIRKELPPGQTVVFDVTPPKSGVFSFECGMKMLRGSLVVR
jgi:hypothetical protein